MTNENDSDEILIQIFNGFARKRSGKAVLPDSGSSPKQIRSITFSAASAASSGLTGLGKAPVDLIVFGNQPPAYGVALVMRSVGYILPEKTIVACNGLNSALARAVAPFGVR